MLLHIDGLHAQSARIRRMAIGAAELADAVRSRHLDSLLCDVNMMWEPQVRFFHRARLGRQSLPHPFAARRIDDDRRLKGGMFR